LLKADLHIHTRYSMDCDMQLEEIIARVKKRGLNCIAIADHGTIEGALALKKIAPFKVIIAEEVLTPYGEIMGVFLKEGISSGTSVPETIARIREQNGIVLIPHPFDRFRPSALDREVLKELAGKKQLDVIEVFNARAPLYRSTVNARAFARKHGLPMSAGSDAHTPHEIGNAYVEMPEFNSRDEFLKSLAQGRIVGHRTNPLAHVNSLWARLRSNLR
jgi:predicted metal-dependent phosphoesterase TrpH